MSALEQEIMERFRQLDDAAKLRVIASLEGEIASSSVSLGEWLAQATAFREHLRAKYGGGYFFGIQDMLDEIREEASWPRW